MERVKGLTQAYSQAPWRKQLQIIGIFSALLIFAALTVGVYLNLTARAATLGRQILLLQDQIEETKQINADLETKIAYELSARRMVVRARELGFVPINKEDITYLVVPGYIPRQLASLAPPPEPVVVVPAALPPNYTESLFGWLWRQVMPFVTQQLGAQP